MENPETDYRADARARMMVAFAELTDRHARVTEALDDFTHVRQPTVKELLAYILKSSPIHAALSEVVAAGLPPDTGPRDKPFPAASVEGCVALLDLALTLQMLMACTDCGHPDVCVARVTACVTFESGHSIVVGVPWNGETVVRDVKLANDTLGTPETPAPPETPVTPPLTPIEVDPNADLV
jgi:hypothetical protein